MSVEAARHQVAYTQAHGFLPPYALGRAEETEAHILEALRISPRDISAYLWMSTAGNAKLSHLNEGQKVSFELRADRKTGKSKADNLRV